MPASSTLTSKSSAPAPGSSVDRYARILNVLAKHGFVVLEQEVVHQHDRDEVRAAQLRMALEELGPLFIKLGQFIASQSVALPQPYRLELAKLQDDVPPISADLIEAVIVRSLGRGVGDLFASFDGKPLGSASVGQVHAARLADGRDVVVKVKKPGVDDLVATDLSILDRFVRRLSPHVAFLRDMHADDLLPEFERAMRAELDYAAEAAPSAAISTACAWPATGARSTKLPGGRPSGRLLRMARGRLVRRPSLIGRLKFTIRGVGWGRGYDSHGAGRHLRAGVPGE